MMFSYWNSDDHRPIEPMINAWRMHGIDIRVIGDEDVLPFIKKNFPDRVKMFKRIRIPACRSDVARLIFLYEHGGFYVDAHCGVRHAHAVDRFLSRLDHVDTILFDRYGYIRSRSVHRVINAFMFSRPRATIILDLLQNCLLNLLRQYQREKKKVKKDYNIWSLTGPGSFHRVCLEKHRLYIFNHQWVLKQKYAERVRILAEVDAPVVRNMYRGYSDPGAHWSERQKHEQLFDL